jgi:hypothetical protein
MKPGCKPRLDTHHDVDDGLCIEAGDRRAADVFDGSQAIAKASFEVGFGRRVAVQPSGVMGREADVAPRYA